MTAGDRMLVHPTYTSHSLIEAPEGAVFHVQLHELRWSDELRALSPRYRLLEPGRMGWILVELVDDWPGHPDYWPPQWAPGAPLDPNWGRQPSKDFRTIPGR